MTATPTGPPVPDASCDTSQEASLAVHLLGVRGSTPAPGAEFVQVGGHTSCLAIAPVARSGARWLVLDAGTGFRNLASVLGDVALDADVVLTHLHWDHVQGLPFLRNADRPDARIDLWIPVPAATPEGSNGSGGATVPSSDEDALELLARGFAPPSFPIRPDELGGVWRFHAAPPGALDAGGPDTTVRTAQVHHKGGTTLAVRVERAGRSLAYLPDHCIGRASADELERARRICAGVDVLLHDSQYLEHERTIADDFGHCTAADAVDLAVAAGVGRLVLVHHAPSRADDAIAAVLGEATERITRLRAPLAVELGREGQVLRI